MKKIYNIFLLLMAISLFSCEQGELKNSEADIEAVIFPEAVNSLLGKPIISNKEVRVPKTAVIEEDIQTLEELLQNLSIELKLTEGATVSPDPAISRDYTSAQKFTVTSEDGKWSKDYEVSFFSARLDIRRFDFEHVEISSAYENYTYNIFYEIEKEEKHYIWSSGNGGFMMMAYGKAPDYYPTFSIPNGKTGKGLKLVTRSTGSLGKNLDPPMPLAAGNLFLGSFDTSIATVAPLMATQFGMQTTLPEPISLNLWCKYKAGDEYKDRAGNLVNKKDAPGIYAVLFEAIKDSEGKAIMLNGVNAKTAPNIVSIAIITPEQIESMRVDDIENAEYKPIEILFESKQPFAIEKQVRGDYYFTMVMSASENGDLFEGAVGSTLYVDEVELKVKE